MPKRRILSPPFNRHADSYRAHAVVQRRLADWLAEWIEPAETLASLSALDLGAGDGLFTEYLARCCPQTTAIDISPRMVELGQQRLPQVEWRVADAWRVLSSPVDRLYSASLLHWCADPVTVLRRWRQLVNSQGRLLNGYYVSPTLTDWQVLVEDSPPLEWKDVSQWQTIFWDAGWQIVRAETCEYTQHFQSAIKFVRFLHKTGSVSPRCTPVAKLRRMINDYQRNCELSGGSTAVRSTWTFFRIEATTA